MNTIPSSSDVHIRVPRELYEYITNFVVKEGYYRSAPEFILESARRQLSEIKKSRIDERKINVYWHRIKQEKMKMKGA
jgi:Arc/MetJ-type ribon-helix-helix transcriptional regulator